MLSNSLSTQDHALLISQHQYLLFKKLMFLPPHPKHYSCHIPHLFYFLKLDKLLGKNPLESYFNLVGLSCPISKVASFSFILPYELS